mmetsp:Transcript_54169/g.136292  ORF Transcript_54169/g.136292 Transcript_54169/m.136292 type:complete len:210 (+) Transcript_54169:303-932(+)
MANHMCPESQPIDVKTALGELKAPLFPPAEERKLEKVWHNLVDALNLPVVYRSDQIMRLFRDRPTRLKGLHAILHCTGFPLSREQYEQLYLTYLRTNEKAPKATLDPAVAVLSESGRQQVAKINEDPDKFFVDYFATMLYDEPSRSNLRASVCSKCDQPCDIDCRPMERTVRSALFGQRETGGGESERIAVENRPSQQKFVQIGARTEL